MLVGNITSICSRRGSSSIHLEQHSVYLEWTLDFKEGDSKSGLRWDVWGQIVKILEHVAEIFGLLFCGNRGDF